MNKCMYAVMLFSLGLVGSAYAGLGPIEVKSYGICKGYQSKVDETDHEKGIECYKDFDGFCCNLPKAKVGY